MFKGCSRLDVVNAFHIRDIRAKACIGEFPVLAESLRLKVRSQIVKGVRARVVVKLIPTYKTAKRKHRGRPDQTCPGRRDVKRPNLRALIRRSQRLAGDRVEESRASGVASEPLCGQSSGVTWMELLVERIGSLKPGTRVAAV